MSRTLRLSVVAAWSALLAAALVFLALQGRRVLLLDVDMEVGGGGAVVGEVWWAAGQRPFHPADSTSFLLGPGRQRVTVRLPVEIDTLQIRPTSRVGAEVTLHAVVLRTPLATLRSWGGPDGFPGWHDAGGLADVRVQDGALLGVVRDVHGSLQVDDVAPLRDGARRRAHVRIALAAGLLAGLLQAAAFALLFPRGAPASAAAVPAGAPRRTPKGAWLLFGATTAVCLVVAWFVGRALLGRTAPPVFTDTGEYSLVFVDHLGRRLSEKDGGLKLALDALTFYRNAPDQKSARFSIDAHGYRGGFDAADPRPRVLVLGGSAAFGFGLDADEQVFTSRLARRRPEWQVVNASVVGHLSGQELSELVHRGADVKASVVVAFDGWNDLYVPLLAATRFPAAGLAAGFNWDVFHMVENRLRLLTLGGARESPVPGAAEPVPDLARRIAAAYASNLEKMNAVCASRGAGFVVVFQPWLGSRRTPRTDAETRLLATWTGVGERASPALYDALVDGTRRFLAERGIPFVDLHHADAFATPPGALFMDIVHMTPEGHDVAARELEAPVAKLMAAGPKRPPAPDSR